ncbi:TPA: DUF551 domain-containing protein [Klebsiella pneumoniae]|nr:DUF551 domain-containing protein [Klebsiella pneumoniae]
MTKSTITRERLEEIVSDPMINQGSEFAMMARMALAVMDSESWCLPLDYLQGHKDGLEWASQLAEANHPETGDWLYDDPIELAKAIRKGPDMPPVQLAPVVPDDVLKALQKVARIRLDMDGFDGDRRGIADCLCDAEEALIEVVNRRAAMFNHPEQHLDMVDHSGDVNEKGGDGNSPVIPDGWTCNDKANAALMMLDRIETVDPVDDDRVDGIKRIVRELAAATQSPGSDPATVPGKWIPVSEQMPDVGVKVLCFPAKDEPIHATFNGQLWLQDVSWSGSEEPIDNVIPVTVTHWMPLPTGPQEVKDAHH